MLKACLQCVFVATVLVGGVVLSCHEGKKIDQKNLKIALATGEISSEYYTLKNRGHNVR